MKSENDVFDVMTITSKYQLRYQSLSISKESQNDCNMYNCIDWDLVKLGTKLFQKKQARSLKTYDKDFEDKISFIIMENFNVERGSIYNNYGLAL